MASSCRGCWTGTETTHRSRLILTVRKNNPRLLLREPLVARSGRRYNHCPFYAWFHNSTVADSINGFNPSYQTSYSLTKSAFCDAAQKRLSSRMRKKGSAAELVCRGASIG